VGGAIAIILGCAVPGGAQFGWWGYLPLSSATYSPGTGTNLWVTGVALAACGMLIQSGTMAWTILTRRAPGMTMMHMPVFVWSELVSCFMGLTAFPSLLAGMGLLAVNRVHPFNINFWNLLYEHMFWFYGHPVVYIMFFPFVGCVSEVLATFSGRRNFAYKGTVLALLVFAAGSMAVWGHHLFTSGQVTNDYYSLTSNFLAIPAGVEYFSLLGTIIGGRLRYTTAMLFGLAFIPQFLIGGLSGILVADPAIDYQVNNSYFIVAHFHYTLLAGSMFGFFAGVYYWLPKATGIMVSERLGKLHFILMTIGTNATFLPMFALGMLGMPRRVATYPANEGLNALNLTSTIGAFIIGCSLLVFVYNIYISNYRKVPAPPDPWQGNTLEWATSSPPPRFNFTPEYPVPRIRSYTPLLDIRERASQAAADGGERGQPGPDRAGEDGAGEEST
jgi:cytochrome c oxidase subunit I